VVEVHAREELPDLRVAQNVAEAAQALAQLLRADRPVAVRVEELEDRVDLRDGASAAALGAT
jgi:hypothetical protein